MSSLCCNDGSTDLFTSPDSKKAAAEGAAIWYVKQLVVARAARSTFGGCPCSSYPSCRPTAPQVSPSCDLSSLRIQSTYQGSTRSTSTLTVSQNVVPLPCEKGLTSQLSGVKKINGFFETWVKKNSVIGEELSKTFSYVRMYTTLDHGLGTFALDIYAYEQEGNHDWAWDESGNLLPNVRRVCTLSADLSGLRNHLKVQKGPTGQDFWTVSFRVNVMFGGTALKARLSWDEGVSISYFPSTSHSYLAVPFRLPGAKAPSALFRTRSTRSYLPFIYARSNERFPVCN